MDCLACQGLCRASKCNTNVQIKLGFIPHRQVGGQAVSTVRSGQTQAGLNRGNQTQEPSVPETYRHVK